MAGPARALTVKAVGELNEATGLGLKSAPRMTNGPDRVTSAYPTAVIWLDKDPVIHTLMTDGSVLSVCKNE